jgi:hypothetical protein
MHGAHLFVLLNVLQAGLELAGASAAAGWWQPAFLAVQWVAVAIKG